MKLVARNDLALFLVLLLAAGTLSVFLGQDANWDLLNYHIYNAHAFFHQRYAQDVGVAPQWYFNPALDLPYYALIHFFNGRPRLVAFVQGSQAGLVWFLLWKLFAQARRVLQLDFRLATLAWVVACSGSGLVSEVGTTFNDIPVTALVLCGVWLVCRYCLREAGVGALHAGFFLLGLAVGFKLTSAIYIVAAGIAVLAVEISLATFARAVVFGALGFAVAGAAWSAHLFVAYGNPFFPYFNEIFHSPWWPQAPVLDERFMPRSTWQWAFYPVWWMLPNRGVVTEVVFADARVLVGVVSAVLLACRALFPAGKWASGRADGNVKQSLVLFLGLFYVLSYLLWLFVFSIYRYAMPLEAMAALMFVALVSVFAPTVSEASRRRALWLQAPAALMLLAVLFATHYPNWMRVGYSDRVLGIDADRDVTGAVVIAMQGDPPASFLAPGLHKAGHLLLIGGGDMMATRLYERQTSLVRGTKDIYIVMRRERAYPLLEYIEGYWGLKLTDEPCGTVYTNINGAWQLCRVEKTAN